MPSRRDRLPSPGLWWAPSARSQFDASWPGLSSRAASSAPPGCTARSSSTGPTACSTVQTPRSTCGPTSSLSRSLRPSVAGCVHDRRPRSHARGAQRGHRREAPRSRRRRLTGASVTRTPLPPHSTCVHCCSRSRRGPRPASAIPTSAGVPPVDHPPAAQRTRRKDRQTAARRAILTHGRPAVATESAVQ
jgi:hypothetical protein